MIKDFIVLIANYIFDFYRFCRYSGVFFDKEQQKVEGKINFYYHSIEKGLINDPMRLKFGEKKVKRLIQLIGKWDAEGYPKTQSQFITACTVLCKYHELHVQQGEKINTFFPIHEYEFCKSFSDYTIGGTKSFDSKEYFKSFNQPFEEFSNSRRSLRHFNDQNIPIKTIESVIKIARNAPSVCNRQSVGVKYIDDKQLVQSALKIQGGLNATSASVKQLLIVTSNLNSFVANSERYQMFIDGGIFLQNLLYSLHFYKIGACSLNWSKHFFYDWRMEKLLGLRKSEKIIALVAIGYPIEEFKVPFSNRKKVSEILQIIE